MTGAFNGDGTCRLSIDGVPVQSPRSEVGYMRDYVANVRVPPGQSVKTFTCTLDEQPLPERAAGRRPTAGLSLTVIGPPGTVPRLGRYVVIDRFAPPPSAVYAQLTASIVTAGDWTSAPEGVQVIGFAGSLEIQRVDSIWVNPGGNTGDSVQVTATFTVIGRRHARSAGY